MESKSVLLVANGEIFSYPFLKTMYVDYDYLIAIDGGARHLFEIELEPDFVIGDMDSEVHSTHDIQSLEEITVTTQNDSDLVKALRWCNAQGYSSVDLIGVENGRSDHIIGTYAAIAEANVDIQLKVHLNDFIVHVLGRGDSISLKVEAGKIISAFALLGCKGLSISGTKWNLDDAELEFSTTGLHNESIGGNIDVSLSSGRLALFIQR